MVESRCTETSVRCFVDVTFPKISPEVELESAPDLSCLPLELDIPKCFPCCVAGTAVTFFCVCVASFTNALHLGLPTLLMC